MTEDSFIRFMLAHERCDTGRLLLSAERWPGIDVRRAARNIEARRKIRDKIPSWYKHHGLNYPGSLPLEQCSSEATALYKQGFIAEGARIADITGGLGVDCWFMSRKSSEAHYCEQNVELCALARHNFKALEHRSGFGIQVHEGDGVKWLRESTERFDMIYLDPARRDKASRRVYDISDCQPDLLEIKELLLGRADFALAKISPMADIARILSQIPETREVHVVASGGEVKELLLLMQAGKAGKGTKITAADGDSRFCFSPGEESGAEPRFAAGIKKYLLQPSKAVRKAGAFRLLSERFGIEKLAPNTHLYTSDIQVPGFPGKCFEVEEVLDWGKASIRYMREKYVRTELSAVNFPLDSEELRKRTALAGGGTHHAFATCMGDKKKIVIICRI